MHADMLACLAGAGSGLMDAAFPAKETKLLWELLVCMKPYTDGVTRV